MESNEKHALPLLKVILNQIIMMNLSYFIDNTFLNVP